MDVAVLELSPSVVGLCIFDMYWLTDLALLLLRSSTLEGEMASTSL